MTLQIGVIEWASDSLQTPSVYVGDTEAIMHWAAREMAGYTFDDGGEIDQFRDTYRGSAMNYDELAAWHETMWEYSTEAWLGIYTMPPANGGEAAFIASGSFL